ncbi:hypothetical protein DS901_07215 [Loktanella sp. D2R18]|uniref:DUF6477 family protein n=1 Tax=Rhodobacterales TaxID=204455 RepID=UPI000DEB7786|nr:MULTISPECIES: DUF6477 family protein [Rhodobacterales]MDO6589560.1 DUF6477 family protein [Yoonia sp. 1_MG-2023]RBW44201.1 hypothetical protein DS901_07215 [Loktanella sp. D2R18]
MLDLDTRIAGLKRPTLLARAARFGVDDYRREVHLHRILGPGHLPRHAEAIMRLLDIEAGLNIQRVARDGHYRIAHHVEVLIAIAGEAKLMRATRLRLVTP